MADPASDALLTRVIADELRFKRKLQIGDQAYAILRTRDTFSEMWETAGAAATGAGIAKSAAVAGTFFAPTGIAAWLGLATATTPVGWVIAASIVAGCGYVGVSRWLGSKTGEFSDTIPRYISTPIDVLGVALFEFMGRISLKIAKIDYDFCALERDFILAHFADEWGYDSAFLEHSLDHMAPDLNGVSTEELARGLARFLMSNRDCNGKAMQRDLLEFLYELAAVDGRVAEQEQHAISAIVKALVDESSFSLRRKLRDAWRQGKVEKDRLRDAWRDRPRMRGWIMRD